VTLGMGFLAKSMAGERVALVSEWQGRVDGWKRERQAARAENSRIEEQIARLEKEFGIGNFAVRLLDALQDSLPAQLSLSKLSAQRVVSEEDQYLELVLTGLADNSDRNAIQHLSAFQRSVEELPFVQRVALPPPTQESGTYRFELRVSPDSSPPPERVPGRIQPGKGGL